MNPSSGRGSRRDYLHRQYPLSAVVVGLSAWNPVFFIGQILYAAMCNSCKNSHLDNSRAAFSNKALASVVREMASGLGERSSLVVPNVPPLVVLNEM
jgi:hypothetical protein